MSARKIRRTRQRELAREQKRSSRRALRTGVAAGTAIGATVLLAPSAQAANIEVDTLLDNENDGCGVGLCTLRDAVSDAIANSEDDNITFQSSLSGTIRLTQGEIDLSDPDYGINITETGPNEVTISGDATGNGPSADDSRIFYIDDDGPIGLYGLTLTEGYAEDGGGDADGGAIHIASDGRNVTIADSAVTNSYSDAQGGGIFNSGEGRVVITDSMISGNFAVEAGGGVATTEAGFTRIVNSEISGNYGEGDGGPVGGGGGVSNKYALTVIEGSEISGNDSDSAGGGILNVFGRVVVDESEITGNGLATPAFGGGIANLKYASATVTNSEISGNRAAYAGAGIAHVNGTYAGKYSGGSPFITQTVVQDSLVTDNSLADLDSGIGAGVFALPGKYGDSVLLNRVTISDNSAPGEDSVGGGAFLFPADNASAEIRSSTVSGNSAAFGGGVSFGFPGGINPASAEARADVAKQWRQAVRAEGYQPGELRPYGAEQQPQRSTLANEEGSSGINNSTIADNNASSEGGGLFAGFKYDPEDDEEEGYKVPVSSTIVGDNSAAGSPNDTADAGDPANEIELNYSLVETPGGANVTQDPAGQSILGQDPQLGPLADNGGPANEPGFPTLTHEPAVTSPAVDTGVDNQIGRDQRVELRRVELAAPNNPANDPTDIGSVERQGPLPEPGTRALRASEVPANCPIPFADAATALAGDDSGQTILGGPGSDILRGAGGEDTVDGRKGDDCLTGDKNFDKVVGRRGDDWGAGGGGRDFMKGNAGDDDFNGNGGFDRLRMGSGDDFGKGAAGPDNLAGGDGEDLLKGGIGGDRIFGDNGNDDLRGGKGNDVLFGGGGKNELDCGAGKKDKAVVIKPGRDKVKNCEIVISRKNK